MVEVVTRAEKSVGIQEADRGVRAKVGVARLPRIDDWYRMEGFGENKEVRRLTESLFSVLPSPRDQSRG